MKKRVLITGATGLIGEGLCRHLWAEHWSVTGVARRRPDWWPQDHPFVELDFQNETLDRLAGPLKSSSVVIHLCDLTKTDAKKNRSVATAIYEAACNTSVNRFFYASSIRVYSGRSGWVDEETPTQPAAYDVYGVGKQRIEKNLRVVSAERGLPVTICRFGNVFSNRAPEKRPKPDDALTEFIYRGKNHHLISVANVAFAVCELIKTESLNDIEIVNVTQEAAGENDYYFLEKRLSGRADARTIRLSAPGRWLRFCLCRYRKELGGEYFVTVVEKRLRQLNIRYPVSLVDSLKAVYGS